MPQSVSKAVLITGCSTGIGRATAEHLATRGWNVYATARKLESIADLASRGCKTLALDVCNEASMRTAVQAVERAERKLLAAPARRVPRLSSLRLQPSRLKAILCWSFTPARPVYPAASLRDFLSGAYRRV